MDTGGIHTEMASLGWLAETEEAAAVAAPVAANMPSDEDIGQEASEPEEAIAEGMAVGGTRNRMVEIACPVLDQLVVDQRTVFEPLLHIAC